MRRKLYLFLPILLFALVSCGFASSTSTSLPAPSPLPASTILQVQRTTTIPNNFPPLSRTITKADAIQKLYTAALALPKPTGSGSRPISCRADVGLIYRMRFLDTGKLLQQLDLHPGGCSIIFITKDDLRPAPQAFIQLFAQTIGIPVSDVNILPIPFKKKSDIHTKK